MNQRLVDLLRRTQGLLRYGRADIGYCMCGSPVDGHGFGDGHSPVDAFDYYAEDILAEIDAALAGEGLVGS